MDLQLVEVVCMPASKKLDINLLKEGGIGSRPLGKFLKWSLSYGRYIIIGTQIVVLLAFFSRFILDQQLSDLHTRINEKTNILEALKPVEINTRVLQNKITLIKQLEDTRSLYALVSNTLSEKTPDNVIISQLILNQNAMLINGNAQNNAGLSQFLEVLLTDPLFTQIVIEDITQEEDGSLSFNIASVVTIPEKKQTVASN